MTEQRKSSPFTQMWKASTEREEKQAAASASAEEISPAAAVESSPGTGEKTGQLDSQLLDSQLPSLDSQPTGQPVTQSENALDSQSTPDEKTYPSRRLRKQKTCRLPIQKLEKWELWCYLNKVDFQDAVEMALDKLTGQPVTHILIDDLEDNKETDDVLIFYRKWTGNKISKKDKDARETVRTFSDDDCKIGIATSVFRATAKINSFKYCIGAIEEAAASPIKDRREYLKHVVKVISGKAKPGE
jgi:hypothetical protein